MGWGRGCFSNCKVTCSSRVEKAVSALPGMKECSVNLLKNSMVVQYDEKTLTGTDIIQAVEKAGYGASLLTGGQKKATNVSTEQSVSANAAKKEYETMRNLEKHIMRNTRMKRAQKAKKRHRL